jgi:GTP-binding protein EngB required for normal cell division
MTDKEARVDSSVKNSKQIVLNVLEQISRIAKERGHADLVQQSAEQSAHLASGEFNVIICGEAKRGKSSLINALLEDELCPPDAPVATNTVSAIRYGDTERFVVHLRDRQEHVTRREITRSEIPQYVTEQGNARNGLQVQLLEIWLPNPRLKDGLVLWDTPGVGSLNVEHTAVTYSIVPYADAVLFVCAADEPLSDPELQFATRIAKHTTHIMLVVTKRDTVTNWGQSLADGLTKLRVTLQLPNLEGVAISSTCKMAYAQEGDEEDLRLSGFPDFERALWELLSRRREILIGRAASWALLALENLRRPLQIEHEVLEARSTEQISSIEAELAAALERAAELQSGQALWVDELNRRIQNLRTDAQHWVDVQFRSLHKSLDGYLDNPDYLADPNKLAGMLTVDCNNELAVVLKRVEGKLDAIATDLSVETQLSNLDENGFAVSGTTPIDLSVSPSVSGRRSWLGKASNIGRSSSIHAMGLGTVGTLTGGAIGALVGSIVAPGPGTVAGAQLGAALAGAVSTLIGGIFGFQKGIREWNEKDLEALRQKLGPRCREQLAEAKGTVNREIQTAINDARSDLHRRLLQGIRNEELSIQDARKRLDGARRLHQTEVAGRVRSLANQLKHLDNLEKVLMELDELADEPVTQPLRASA